MLKYAEVAVMLVSMSCKKPVRDEPVVHPAKEQTAAPAPSCDALGPKVRELLAHEAKDSPSERRQQLAEEGDLVSTIIVTACHEDHWSHGAIACLLHARGTDDECAGTLTPEQEEKLEARFTSEMR